MISNLQKADEGEYECKTKENKIHRFRITIVDNGSQEKEKDGDSNIDEKNDSFQIPTEPPQEYIPHIQFDARPNTTVEFTCGTSTQYDKFIQWVKIDGVFIYLTVVLFNFYIKILFKRS